MNGIICYYSNTGNTKLACEYIMRHCTSVNFTLCNIVKDPIPEFANFDVVGFATWADFLSPSALFLRYIEKLPLQNKKQAFAFCTYGLFYGGTLAKMVSFIKKRGFNLIATHGLHTPENIATMICAGQANEQAPNEKELASFKNFVDELNSAIAAPQKNKLLSLPFSAFLMPVLPRFMGKRTMGPKFVNPQRCTRCGICAAGCPVNAISLTPTPVFNEATCSFCWSCFNRCPTKAIYTKKFCDRGHYPAPLPQLVKKLSE